MHWLSSPTCLLYTSHFPVHLVQLLAYLPQVPHCSQLLIFCLPDVYKRQVLEFTKIRDMLTEKALTDLGAEKCQALVPSTNFQEVTAWQEETEEALVVLTYLGGHPMAPFTDVRPYLNLCDKGATLSPKALLEIAGLMRACRTARAALVTDRENTPRLKEKAGLLGSFRNLEDDITTAIISEDEIADRASVELRCV